MASSKDVLTKKNRQVIDRSAGSRFRLIRIDRSFEPKNGTEGEEHLLTIQAHFARELTTAECASVLLEPYC